MRGDHRDIKGLEKIDYDLVCLLSRGFRKIKLVGRMVVRSVTVHFIVPFFF